METIMTWAKENYDLITIMVGVLGVVISVITLFYEIKKRKNRKEGKG